MNLKSQRCSITLFVLVSCLFFIASVTCVQIYMQSKQIAVDREYRQIKANYEAELANESTLKAAYTQLSQVKNLDLLLENSTQENNKLILEFYLNNTENIEIQTIQYGWGTNASIDTVTEWNYIEKESANDKIIVINNNVSTPGDYHLFVVIDNKEIYKKITI